MKRLVAQSLTLLMVGCSSALPVAAPSPGFPAADQPVAASLAELARLDQSERTWRFLRDQAGGRYQYQVHWQSWVGFGHVTTVSVVNGRVSERKFEPFHLPGSRVASSPVEPGWIERGPEIGSRSGVAAPALTMEELYAVCRQLLSQTRPPASSERLPHWQVPVLTLDERGVLQSCISKQAFVSDDAPVRGVPALSLKMGT